MQKITQTQLIEKAVSLLSDGTVTAVLGWRKGEFGYDVTPTVFKTVEDLKSGFVYNDFCGANFSKYLVSKTKKTSCIPESSIRSPSSKICLAKNTRCR